MKIGAGWLKRKEEKVYLSCEVEVPFLGKLNFIMTKNEKKDNPQSPDYDIVWLGERKNKTETIPEDIPF